MYEEKSIQARKQVAPIQCQATMWLTAFGFHVLCLGKTKSVFTGFLKSCTTNGEHHNPQKSDSKWPLNLFEDLVQYVDIMLSTCRDACQLVPWQVFTLVVLRNLNFVQKGNLETPWCSKLVKVKVTQSCPALCDPMDYTVHRILQARMLEWVVFPNPGIELRSPALQVDSLPAELQGKPKNTGVGSLFLLQWIFPTQESNQGLLHCRWILSQLSYQGSPLPGLEMALLKMTSNVCVLGSRSLSIEASPSYDSKLFMRDAG